VELEDFAALCGWPLEWFSTRRWASASQRCHVRTVLMAEFFTGEREIS
jgi:hypothetical protein